MKKLSLAIGLGLLVLASSWALFHPEFFRVHDYIHAARVIEMQRALQDGHFLPRWSRNFGFGYGMPLFEFYAPLPYFVGALISMLGLSVLGSVKMLFLLANLLTAVGSYKLGKELFGKRGGLLVAAAITLAPYRAVNLFVRGALSETWGIMAMPWVLWAIVRVVKQQKDAWRDLTLSTVVLMLSHNIMTMIFMPFAGLFSMMYVGYRKWVVHKDKKSELKTLLKLLGAVLLALAMSSFYVFPALVENKLTKVSQIFLGYFHYSHHFLYIRQFFQLNWGFEGSAWGPDDGISFFLGWGQLAALGLLAVLIVWHLLAKWKKSKGKISALFSDDKLNLGLLLGSILLLSLFLSILKSKPLWDVLPALLYVQFPWRFLGVGIIFVGLLAGLMMSLIEKTGKQVLLGSLLFVIILSNGYLFRPKEFLEDSDQFYYTSADLIQREMSGVLPDYIPLQMADKLVPPQEQIWCDECELEYEIKVDRTQERLYQIELDEPQLVNIGIADFPGWQVEVDGQVVEKVGGEFGNLAVNLPAGNHQVGVIFKDSPIRLVSDLVSLISWLVFGYLTISFKDEDE